MAHISFSELKMWSECPYKRKLVYQDKLKGFQGNIFTAFGSAVHSGCEKYVEDRDIDLSISHFIDEYSKGLSELPKEVFDEISQKDAETFLEQGLKVLADVPSSIDEEFGKWELISAEEMLYEPIKEFVEKEYLFKGYIDLVIKTEDGRYHIIDWKTCSWGWDARRRSDAMNVYQLIFYKHYYALKHGIDIDNIDVHFGLLKRTAKPGASVEIFKTTSGKIRTQNALKLLNQALYNVSKDRHIKNKTSCHGNFGQCEFYKTEHCP
tara:strand:- start:883 stop:1677 length:795 start_codon:yes stop_codon:yes gene_type:complete